MRADLLAAGFLLLTGSAAGETAPKVLVATYAGVISPIAAEYMTGAIARANDEHYNAVVIQLDTPGGLDLAMRDIVKAELASTVPVVVYVAPSGARAASAGVFITMAANVAAMAPGTNIGAAHPIDLGNPGGSGKEKDEKGSHGDVMEAKMTNDAVAYLQSIARKRGRNADWAGLVVSKSTSVPSGEAVREGVVDMEADTLDDVLKKVGGGKFGDLTITALKRPQITRYDMTQRQKMLATVVDPNVAMILMSVGVAGIMIELYSPGLILPGIVGAVSLITAFYSFQTLSASFAGLLLIGLGFLLFLLEFKVHSFGLLTLSGAASILFGSLMLFRDASGGLAISKATIAGTIGPLLIFLIGLLYVVRKVLGRRARTGAEGLHGAKGVAATALNPQGTVNLGSEVWRAVSVSGDIAEGAEVIVVETEGLTLKVRKKP